MLVALQQCVFDRAPDIHQKMQDFGAIGDVVSYASGVPVQP